MSEILRLLFLGDIVGPLGREACREYLNRERKNFDFVIANGENTTHGRGLSLAHYNELKSLKIDCITSGNHFFNCPDYIYSDRMDDAIRPLNFDKSAPGKGFKTFLIGGLKIRVINLIGRQFMNLEVENPFKIIDEILKEDGEFVNVIDFHAEATAEKVCLANYVDGRVSAVIGTHTHVQTNDARLLDKGTFFLTDVGMNGAYTSSIGSDLEPCINKAVTGIPCKMSIPRRGRKIVNGVSLSIDGITRSVVDFKMINEVI